MTHSENRLSLEQVEEIMIELRNETSLTVIAKDFGISRGMIHVSYTHMTPPTTPNVYS